MTIRQFREVVWKHHEQEGRHTLPWRKTTDPYKILVSELMLQQTQVDRVVPYYTKWMKQYPNVRSLAAAPLKDVLTAWQGLGYNRRAKMLHEAAKAVVAQYKGKLPHTIQELESLPGIGPYTAGAVLAFAYNQDVVFVETNLRTAVTHHFFSDRSGIPDNEVLEILTRALPRGNSRAWYAALMDYGAYLKRSGIRINAKSKSYVKQSAFAGSGREVRGAIVRALTQKPQSALSLKNLFPQKRHEQVQEQLARLQTEKLIEKHGRVFSLPN